MAYRIKVKQTSTLPDQPWTIDSWKAAHITDILGDDAAAFAALANDVRAQPTAYELVDNIMYITSVYTSEDDYRTNVETRLAWLQNNSYEFPVTREVIEQGEV